VELVEALGLLEPELRPLLELCPLLELRPLELLPELAAELCPLLEPEPEEELLWPELPPPPLEPELAREEPEPAELEEPELCMKLPRGASRRGSEDLPPLEEGEESAEGEVAPEPEPLLLAPLPPELAPPLEPELEPGVEESRIMLSGNWRRDAGTRARPDDGEESSEAAPEPPELKLPPEPELPGPELVITPPDWPPPRRRSRALRIASCRSTSRSRPEGRPPESAAGRPLPPEPADPPEPLPAFTPEPPVGVPLGPEPGVPTTPEPLPPAGFPPLLPRASRSLRRPGPGSSGGRMVVGPRPTTTGSRRPVGGGGVGAWCPGGGLWTATTGLQWCHWFPGRQHQPCPLM